MSEPFIGEIKIFPYSFAPKGWAYCDGQIMQISQNQALYSLLGTTYGGNGTSTFALPNLQGRVPIGAGTGPGLSSRPLGQSSGSNSVTLNITEIPAHNHTLAGESVDGTQRTVNNAYPAQAGSLFSYQGAASPLVQMNGAAVANSGSSQPHNNMQPYLGINYCIALVGLFPSRN
jgi:microcystin-dependent protein